MIKNEYFDIFRKFESIKIPLKNILDNLFIYLFSAALYKLIIVLHRDVLLP
jgi:hypothetical protein